MFSRYRSAEASAVRHAWWAVAGCALALAVAAPARAAETVYGLTAGDKLISFSSSAPLAASTPVAISGLAAGEDLEGVDFRPATNQLLGWGSSGRVYRIDTVSGAATQIGQPVTSPAPTGSDFSIDFNPTVDRLRVVSEARQNLRLNPNTGGATGDTQLDYPTGDPNQDTDPIIEAVAYTQSYPASTVFPDVPSTALFAIDSGANSLVRITDPNAGTLSTIATLKTGGAAIDAGPTVGLDVATTPDGGDVAYALLARTETGAPAGARLYRLNLATAVLTLLGTPPAADPVEDIAIAPQVATFIALTDATPQQLVGFRQDRPGVVSAPIVVSGLPLGERLVGIDTRPANGGLYAVSASSRVYRIDTATGAATQVGGGQLTPAVGGSLFGVDFNPAADRLRIVSDQDRNGRFHPDTLAPGNPGALDGDLAYAAADANAGRDAQITAGAYTNSVPAAGTTTLFDIDTQGSGDLLATQDPPNNGILNTVGALTIDATGVNGYDIVPRFNHGFAALQKQGETVSRLYAVNIAGSAGPPLTRANGGAVEVGQIGLPAGTLVAGLTLPSGDRVAFASSTHGAAEAAGTVTVAVTRSGGGDGVATVKYATADGSATAGGDYQATSGMLSFAPGETVKTVTVGIVDDAASESSEAFRVALSDATGTTLGSLASATVTIADDDPPPAAAAQPTATPTPRPATARAAIAGMRALTVAPRRDRTRPYSFRVTGALRLPAGLSPAQACAGGLVSISTSRAGRRVGSTAVKLSPGCAFAKTVRVTLPRRARRPVAFTLRLRFLGTAALLPNTLPSLTIRAG